MVPLADIMSTPQLEMEDGLDCRVEVLIWRVLVFGELFQLFHWEPASRHWKQFGVEADWSIAGLCLFPCYIGFLNLKSDCFNLHVTGKHNHCITLHNSIHVCLWIQSSIHSPLPCLARKYLSCFFWGSCIWNYLWLASNHVWVFYFICA